MIFLSKRYVKLIILLLTLCMFVSSCGSGLPLRSETFNDDFIESFYENYSLVDPQLAYFSAPWFEVEIPKVKDQEGANTICLGLIDREDKSLFVSVSENNGVNHYVHVYQSDKAPVPMMDWTIKKVSIFYTGLRYTSYVGWREVENDKEIYNLQTAFKYHLDKSILIQEYDPINNASLINSIKDAYVDALPSPKSNNTGCIFNFDPNGPNHYYCIMVEFEESDNIVWWSNLYEGNGELYLKCNNYKYHEYEKYQNYYFKLPEELNNEIIEILRSDGCKIPESTTAEETEETTENPYQPTSKDPNESIFWPYDD